MYVVRFLKIRAGYDRPRSLASGNGGFIIGTLRVRGWHEFRCRYLQPGLSRQSHGPDFGGQLLPKLPGP